MTFERERLVRLRRRAQGPRAGRPDPDDAPPDGWACFRVAEAQILPGSKQALVAVRAWVPPFSGDCWPEYHRPSDLEAAPADPRSAAEVEALPLGELVAVIRALREKLGREDGHQFAADLSASDLDLLEELPRDWDAGRAIALATMTSAEKLATHLVERFERARSTVIRRQRGVRDEAMKLLCGFGAYPLDGRHDLGVALRALKACSAEAYAARHAWVADLRLAAVGGRRPSSDVRRRRAVARALARLSNRYYVLALEADEEATP